MSLLKNFKIVVLLLLIASVCSGCMNQTNLKDLLVVEGVAIDSADDKIEMTIQILNTAKSTGTEKESGNMTINVTQKGNTIIDATNNLAKSVSKEIFFSHNKVVVFGRELCEKGFEKRIDYFLRSNDSRPDVAVCIADGKALKIMENTENDAHVPVENIVHIINNGQKNGNSIYVNVEQMLNAYSDKTTQICLPVLKEQKDNDNSSLGGIGIFRDDRLVYVLDEKETLGFMLMSGKITNCIVSYNDERLGVVATEIVSPKVKNKVTVNENGITFNVSINAKLMINEVERGTVVSLDKKSADRICANIEDELIRCCYYAFSKCQEYNSDCIRVGEYLARDNASAYNQMADDWDTHFRTVKLNCDINARLKKISDNTQLD